MPPRGGKETAIPQSVIGRLAGTIRGKIDAWFGPGSPQAPAAPETKGRQFDFAPGSNLLSQPRGEQGESAITFQTLRNMAEPALGGLGLLRLAIEKRKKQMRSQNWTVQSRDEALGKNDPRAKAVALWLRRPDGVLSFRNWLNVIVEESLVLDAATIYLRPSAKEMPYLEAMDGSTIKRVLDGTGRTPLPPQTAYQQHLKGFAASDYSVNELVYAVRNPRAHRIYGYSEVEQVVDIIDFALRRSMSQMAYYTEGNIPEALVQAPQGWTAKQIEEFQAYFDTAMSGDLSRMRRLKWVPGGTGTPVFTRDPKLKDEVDEWLARVICFCFDLSPQALVRETNRATAETAKEAAQEEGLEPLKLWFKDAMDDTLEKAGTPDLEFVYEDEEIADPMTKARVTVALCGGPIFTKDEGRAMYGKAVLTPEQKAELSPPPDPFGGFGGGGGGAPHPFGGGTPPPGEEGAEEGKPKEPDPGVEGIDAGERELATRLARRALRPIDRRRPLVLRTAASLQKAVQRHLTRQGKAVGAWVRANGISRDGLDAAIDSSDQAAAFSEFFERVARDGARLALEALFAASRASVARRDTAFDEEEDELLELLDQAHERAAKWATEHAADLVTQIDETTRTRIRALVVDAIEEGQSPADLAKEIETSVLFSEARAETVARTEVAYADVQGTLIGWSESNLVARKEWSVSQDEVCDDCLSMHGQVVGIDEDFDGPDGAVAGPPYHPRCRCDVLPVLAEEEARVQRGDPDQPRDDQGRWVDAGGAEGEGAPKFETADERDAWVTGHMEKAGKIAAAAETKEAHTVGAAYHRARGGELRAKAKEVPSGRKNLPKAKAINEVANLHFSAAQTHKRARYGSKGDGTGIGIGSPTTSADARKMTAAAEAAASKLERVGVAGEVLRFDPGQPRDESGRWTDSGSSGAGGETKGAPAIASTPEFKGWFGDSKARDDDGAPLVLYHGTNADVTAFRPFSHFGTAKAANDRYGDLREFSEKVVGRDPGAFSVLPVFLKVENPLRVPDLASMDALSGLPMEEARQRLEERGIDPDDNETEDHIRPAAWESEGDLAAVLVQMGEMDSDEYVDKYQYRSTEETLAYLKAKGYDGVVYENAVEDAGKDSWIVFDPSQVKSATGNRGTFDPKDPDIRHLARYSENQPRDASGKWTSDGGGSAAAINELPWDAKGNLSGSLGVPRSEMPQIRTPNIPEFLAGLADEGVAVTNGSRQVGQLKPTQAEVHPKHVAEMKDLPGNVLKKPVMVSSDGYVMDGHHRWAALYMKGSTEEIPTNEVGLPIRELLEKARAFSKVEFKRAARAGEVMRFDPDQPRDDSGQWTDGGGGSVAYQGGPASGVREWDDKFIGSGQGAATYGHGHYFAEEPAVANSYFNQLRGLSVRQAGGWVSQSSFGNESATAGALDAVASRMRDGQDAYNALASARANLKRALHLHGDEETREALAFLKALKPSDLKLEAGAIYQVQVPSAEALLDWDKPLSEQPGVLEKLQAAGRVGTTEDGVRYYTAAGQRMPLDEKRGEHLYAGLSEELGDNAAASKALKEAGIPGHRYLDNESRELRVGQHDDGFHVYHYASGKDLSGPLATREEADAFAEAKRTRNLVVYDPKVVRFEAEFSSWDDLVKAARQARRADDASTITLVLGLLPADVVASLASYGSWADVPPALVQKVLRAMVEAGLANQTTDTARAGEVARFDPDQPRDESGKWTDAGGGAAGETDSRTTAYQGSPAKGVREWNDKFIGSGQGAATYGIGHYFAEEPSVALSYFHSESHGKGAIYQVRVPPYGATLDWDKPYPEQPKGVREKLEAGGHVKVMADGRLHLRNGETVSPGRLKGETLYQAIAEATGNQAEASRILKEAGIPGLRYLDASSRERLEYVGKDPVPESAPGRDPFYPADLLMRETRNAERGAYSEEWTAKLGDTTPREAALKTLQHYAKVDARGARKQAEATKHAFEHGDDLLTKTDVAETAAYAESATRRDEWWKARTVDDFKETGTRNVVVFEPKVVKFEAEFHSWEELVTAAKERGVRRAAADAIQAILDALPDDVVADLASYGSWADIPPLLVQKVLRAMVEAGIAVEADDEDEAAARAFDPGQPRDDSGQWTDTGGGEGKLDPELTLKAAKAASAAHQAAKRWYSAAKKTGDAEKVAKAREAMEGARLKYETLKTTHWKAVEAATRAGGTFEFDETELAREFDPDQPRDDSGKWTDAGEAAVVVTHAPAQVSDAVRPLNPVTGRPELTAEEKRAKLKMRAEQRERSKALIPKLAETPRYRAFADQYDRGHTYLVHQNTRPGEGNWRVTFINDRGEPYGHIAADSYEKVLKIAHENDADLTQETAVRASIDGEVIRFDPDQPRDESGKWTDTGGGGDDADAPSDPDRVKWPASDTAGRTADDLLSTLEPKERERFDELVKETEAAIHRNEETYKLHSLNGDGTGGWKAERESLHDDILRSVFKDTDRFKPKDGERPTVKLLGGRGGSGKSSFGRELEVYDRSAELVLDADAIKEMLPDYEPTKAFLYHEESSILFKEAVKEARARGLNVVLDITMGSDVGKYIEPFRAAGYQIEAHYMHLPADKAAGRALLRWARPGSGRPSLSGRLVPPQVVLAMTTNEANFQKAAKSADFWSAYSNDVPQGEKPILLGRSKRSTSRRAEVMRFDPDQPRDENGRWTSDGGGTGGDASADRARDLDANVRSIPGAGKAERTASGVPPKDRDVVLVFGGTFNPVHNGHIAAAEQAKKLIEERGYKVKAVIMAPSGDKLAAQKGGAVALNVDDRAALLKAALEGRSDIEASAGPGHDADEYQGKLRRTQLADWAATKYPRATAVNVTGSDQAVGNPSSFPALYMGDEGTSHDGYYYLALPRDESDAGISSSKIRKAVFEGRDPPESHLPKKVLDEYRKILRERGMLV